MPNHPSFIFSLLTLPLLAGMIMFVLVRRPRQPITWTFAGVMVGAFGFYLADVVLYQPGISVQAGLVWQFAQNMGAYLVIVSALILNFLLRDKRLKGWEWAIVGFIVVRMSIDIPWLAGHLGPDAIHSCRTPHGLPRLTCPPGDRLATATGAIAAACVAVLFISTTFHALEPKRQILRHHVLWAVLLIVAGGVGVQILALVDQSPWGVLPGQPATLLGILAGIRLFLALEEEETGVRFPVLGWRILVWLVLIMVAAAVDLSWGWMNAPIWTLVVLAVGIAGAGAFLINSLARHAAAVQDAIDSPPLAIPPLPSIDPATAATTPSTFEPLRIHLLGPMRVVRNGETLPTTAEVWRSAKTRSLLAFLALRREAGATQVEIVDALWPPGPAPNAEAERSSLSAFRSYLSTLRRVLDPEGPRGSDRWVGHEGERYYLRSDEVWVDVWEFELLAGRAEALLNQGRREDGLACWRQAVTLYAPEGLLPDETYLPAEFLEPVRENLRQRWLAGLRRLAHGEEDAGRAADLWDAIHQAEPLDEEAYAWLVEHYRHLGNRSGLRIVQQRRRSAEADLDAL